MVCLIRLSQGRRANKSKRDFNLDAGIDLLESGIARLREGVMAFVAFLGRMGRSSFSDVYGGSRTCDSGTG